MMIIWLKEVAATSSVSSATSDKRSSIEWKPVISDSSDKSQKAQKVVTKVLSFMSKFYGTKLLFLSSS